MQFNDFKLGDIVKITEPSGITSITGKVIAINPVDRSVSFINPRTKVMAGSYLVETSLKLGRTFDLISSQGADDDIVDAQAKIAVWIEKFNRFRNLVTSIFPSGKTGSLSNDEQAKLNQAMTMLNPLIIESDYIPLTPEQRKQFGPSLMELNDMLKIINTRMMIHAENISKLYELLLVITKILKSPIDGLIAGGKSFWDYLTGDWKRMAVAGIAVVAVGGGIYLYLRR